ncbi:sulfite exporter TauE/SafE family protein [Rhizohabitans arisaemae]|uniref:sulfite exporter TauE/SafE family protein n=1 Tax=Rhizohabitans arisaemae TaxID=2720610 RepID=UPI0024B0F8DB|nr:sulfite exporter TauE/SafE family protein [Rhizohabitans arisaemae]
MIVLTLLAAVAVGLTLGLLGGGGSILTVPILIYLAEIEPRQAIAMSLVVVGATAVVALIPHARGGRVHWRTGALFGTAGMAGAYAGGRLAAYLSPALLLVLFGVMMAATAIAMLRPARPRDAVPPASRPITKILFEGTAVGLVTGLVGAGGGFLVVPALVLLGGLPMPAAVGTSLLVIAMKSGAGLAGYLHSTSLDWGLTLAVTAAAIAGSLAGARLIGKCPPKALRTAFGWFTVTMAVFVLGTQAAALF